MTPKEKLNKIYEIIKGHQGEVFDEIRDVLMLGKDKESIRFEKPTIAEIVAYCRERKNGIDGESFYYHYESKGWKIGKSPMKSWKSAIITWEKNNKSNKVNGKPNNSKALTREQNDVLLEIIAQKRAKM